MFRLFVFVIICSLSSSTLSFLYVFYLNAFFLNLFTDIKLSDPPLSSVIEALLFIHHLKPTVTDCMLMVTAQWCSFLIAMNLNNIQTCFHLFVSSRLGVDDSCSSNSSCHFSSVLFHLVSVCCHYVSLVLFPFMVSVPSPAEPLLLLLLQTQYIPFFSHFSCFHFANVCFFISFSQNSFHIIPLRSSSDSMFLLPPPPGPNRSKLQDMLANLRDAEDLPSMQPPVTPPSRPAVPRLSEPEVGRPEDGKLPSVSVHHSVNQLVFSAQTEEDVPHLNT